MNVLSRRSGVIALGLVAAAMAVSASLAGTTGDTQCGIASSSERGMLVLEGTIVSPVALSGEYRFAVQSSGNGGSSNISQGGYFTAQANKPTALGKVLINAGSRYEIVLDVMAGGQKIACDQELESQT